MANKYICTRCGSRRINERSCKGSIIIELFLWLMFIFPGLIYSLWRFSTYRMVCKECQSDDVVPIRSPFGQRVAEQANEAAGLS
jgi:hypothetical protein